MSETATARSLSLRSYLGALMKCCPTPPGPSPLTNHMQPTALHLCRSIYHFRFVWLVFMYMFHLLSLTLNSLRTEGA